MFLRWKIHFFSSCQRISYKKFSNFSTYLPRFQHSPWAFSTLFLAIWKIVLKFFLLLYMQKQHRSKTKENFTRARRHLPKDSKILSTLEYIAKTFDWMAPDSFTENVVLPLNKMKMWCFQLFCFEIYELSLKNSELSLKVRFLIIG